MACASEASALIKAGMFVIYTVPGNTAKINYRRETHTKPGIALVFQKLHDEVPWCICNGHMVKTYERELEWLHIQRVFDPKNPQCKRSSVGSLCIKDLPLLRGATRSDLPLKIQ